MRFLACLCCTLIDVGIIADKNINVKPVARLVGVWIIRSVGHFCIRTVLKE